MPNPELPKTRCTPDLIKLAEIRNKFKIQMSQCSIPYYIAHREMRNDEFDKVWNFCHLIFGFVSNFEIRISSFLFQEEGK